MRLVIKFNSFLRDKHANDQGSDIYGVNAIAFSNQNTFASAGSDGIICLWDKDARYFYHVFHRGFSSIIDILFLCCAKMWVFYSLDIVLKYMKDLNYKIRSLPV